MNREEIREIANNSYLGYEVDIDHVVCMVEEVLEKELEKAKKEASKLTFETIEKYTKTTQSKTVEDIANYCIYWIEQIEQQLERGAE